jgi:hypothetical protein
MLLLQLLRGQQRQLIRLRAVCTMLLIKDARKCVWFLLVSLEESLGNYV